MDRGAADDALARLDEAYRRAGASMFTLDSHAALALLRGGTQRGRTGRLAAELLAEVEALWAHFTIAGQRLDEARALRAAHRSGDPSWERLVALLSQPCVELDGAGLPALVTGGPAATRVGLAELLGGLEARCRAATGRLAELDNAATLLATVLGELTGSLDQARARSAALGVPDRLADVADELARVRDAWLGDVLSTVDNGGLTAEVTAECDRLAGRLVAAHDELDALDRLRATYPETRAALAGEIDALDQAEQAVREADEVVRQKIADVELPEPPDTAAVLRARLPDAGAARWDQLAGELADLRAAVAGARHRADQLAALARGLLDRRAELRGRLDAYRAKAAALGLAEEETLSVRYVTARELLYQAPCDLRRATRAVHDYQQTLADLTLAAAGGKEPTP